MKTTLIAGAIILFVIFIIWIIKSLKNAPEYDDPYMEL